MEPALAPMAACSGGGGGGGGGGEGEGEGVISAALGRLYISSITYSDRVADSTDDLHIGWGQLMY